jgi:hypothetical protein
MMSRAPLFALLALALPAAGCPTSNTVPDCTPIDLSWIETAPRCGDDLSLYTYINAPGAVTPGCQVFVQRLDFSSFFGAEAPNLRGIRATLSDVGFYGAPNLTSLSGLETVERIGGRLQIRDMPVLPNLRGLRSLRSVRFLVVDNTTVTSLEGAEQLQEVEVLTIRENRQLTSLRGLDGLCRVTGGLNIYGNRQLPESEIQAFLERVEVTGPIVLTRP